MSFTTGLMFPMTLALVQGLFSPRVSSESHRHQQCSAFLTNSTSYVIPKSPTARVDLKPYFRKAVSYSLVEDQKLKEEITNRYPPDRHDYIFLDDAHAVLYAMFASDPLTKNRSVMLPISMIGVDEEITYAHAGKVVQKILDVYGFTPHEDSRKIVIAYSENGYDIREFDKLLSEYSPPSLKGATLVILGRDLPKIVYGERFDLKSPHVLIKTSVFLEALTQQRAFARYAPTTSKNVPYWRLLLAHSDPEAIVEKRELFLQLMEALEADTRNSLGRF